MQNIVLIGFMGTGKTAVGRIVARILNYRFIDTDQLVEDATGLTINQIFRKHGEIRFRSEESLVVSKLAGKTGLVIATGGGVVLNPDNIKVLKQNGIFIYLNADPEVILERVSRRNTRPLLAKGKNLETIQTLFQERYRYYQDCADYTIDTSHLGLEEAAQQIVRLARQEIKEGRVK